MRKIFKKNKVFFIAEMSSNHQNDFNKAKKIISAISQTGADAIKFQTHYAESESSLDDKFRIKSFYVSDKTRFDYWKRMQFTENEWFKLSKYASKKGLIFLSTPFSSKSVKFLYALRVRKKWAASCVFRSSITPHSFTPLAQT